ncbi:ABC transporter ATP-binding protein [Aeromicrobium sp. PE09-221]|uniref:ABC transporter ATP-binding protein n=1 Tax=Aeromicrobium sp. PE09-221 TaxID=1898043 RepID=UPI000B3E5C46|nr:ABC transporter ATP-binding protein [Aeromicrobium sp. PE09-221]OUZ08883.1 ABC transporter ATP-binding protein [Aeromicrobium sp. PE09-221]
MSTLEVAGVTAGYGRESVLDGVDFTVDPGHIAAVLGPSGCGKTTLLRALAGHHRITAGQIRVDGRVIADGRVHTPPERRSITVVPQEGGLFPHLDVSANIGFGLRRGPERSTRIAEMLELVGLSGEAKRRPHQISGGQQQRVALARALAPRPSFVLLDEPFSALDAHLREALRAEVKDLLRAEGATAILVTHDQAEALAMGDTVAVMRAGRVVQQDTPSRVYGRPIDAGVARFLGDSVVVEAHEVAEGFATTVLGRVPVAGEGGAVLLRPEQLDVSAEGAPAKVVSTEFRGAYTRVVAVLHGETDEVVVHTRRAVDAGATIGLTVTGEGWLLPG